MTSPLHPSFSHVEAHDLDTALAAAGIATTVSQDGRARIFSAAPTRRYRRRRPYGPRPGVPTLLDSRTRSEPSPGAA
jgi:hypothetical protein